jgi:hypothetical protein
MPSEKSAIYFNLAYTDSVASYDQVNYPAPTDQPGIGYYDFTRVNSYSNLDIEQFDITLNGMYQFTEMIGLQVGGAYRIYTDNEPYLYDQSGDLWVVNAGLSFFF